MKVSQFIAAIAQPALNGYLQQMNLATCQHSISHALFASKQFHHDSSFFVLPFRVHGFCFHVLSLVFIRADLGLRASYRPVSPPMFYQIVLLLLLLVFFCYKYTTRIENMTLSECYYCCYYYYCRWCTTYDIVLVVAKECTYKWPQFLSAPCSMCHNGRSMKWWFRNIGSKLCDIVMMEREVWS